MTAMEHASNKTKANGKPICIHEEGLGNIHGSDILEGRP